MVAAMVVELAHGQEKDRCSLQADPLFARCAHHDQRNRSFRVAPRVSPDGLHSTSADNAGRGLDQVLRD
jgi:hypothetical protein